MTSGWTRNLSAVVAGAACITISFASAFAQSPTCGEKYRVKAGDTLSKLARKVYGDGNKWTLLYYANQQTIGKNPSLLYQNIDLSLPCLETATVGVRTAASSAAQRASGKIRLLTGADFPPFTDRVSPNGGVITDLVTTALRRSYTGKETETFKVSWVDQWSKHLNPLLSTNKFDLGFPWSKPKCAEYNKLDDPAKLRCDNFVFSKPVFQVLVVFFARKDSDFKFNTASDVEGRRLCRPAGYATFDLDESGRNWVRDNKVTLVQPETVPDCFQLLIDNKVDAVALNEFTGWSVIRRLGFGDRVRTLDRPITLADMHVIAAKSNPRAGALIKHVNQALDNLRKSGAYREIVQEHIAYNWKKAQAKPAVQTPVQSYWLTDKTSGCQVWSDEAPSAAETVTWTGPCSVGRAEGRGKLTWMRDGKNVLTYDGVMLAGKLNGQGVLEFNVEGGVDRLEGVFRDGDVSGGILYKSAAGDLFEGGFENGKPHGLGYEKAGDEEFTGQFVRGVRQGLGTLIGKTSAYVGEFENNQASGSGLLEDVQEGRYHGQFRNGKPHGFGTYITKDGKAYHGRFKNGKADGQFLVLAKGSKAFAAETWKDGKKVK